MKKAASIFMCIVCTATLVSCSAKTSKALSADEIKSAYENAENVSAQASVRVFAQDGMIFDFTLDYVKNPSEEYISVCAPEEILGVVIPIKNGMPVLNEKSVSVEDGLYPHSDLSAVNVIPQIINALSGEVASDIAAEKLNDEQCTVAEYNVKTDNAEYLKKIWIDNTSCKPVSACVYRDGVQIIKCDFLRVDIS